jgi:hypothetical protein
VTKETLASMQNMDADELTKLVMAGNLDLRVKRAPKVEKDWAAMSKPTPSGRTLLAMENHKNADPDMLPDYHDSDWCAATPRRMREGERKRGWRNRAI